MIKVIKIIEGKIVRNPYGDWDDVDKGLYCNDDNINDLLSDYEGKNIRITIEEIPKEST